MDLVSQTLQVKTIARSCLEDVFKLDLAENFTEEVSLTLIDVATSSGFGLDFKVSASLFSTSSQTGLIGFVWVMTPR